MTMRRWPSGGLEMSPRRSSGASHEGGQTGGGHKNAEPVLLAPRGTFLLVGDYAAAFFADFDADLGAIFLLAFPFSFAANSCLTVAEMASTSTL